MTDKIMGGYFLTARQIFDSKIWIDKPSTWKVIWLYIFGNVNHSDNGKFKRGEGFFNFQRELKNIGCDITYDMIRHAIRWFKDQEMISTSRSTRGTIIKVLKFDKYQDASNYTGTLPSTSKAQEKHIKSTPIHKNDKNDKNIIIGKANKLKYKWQEDALSAIKWFKDGEQYKSRIFKCFKENEQFANTSLMDCKELARKETMYFFAVFNKLNK
jgi:hypothetical protein